MCKANESRLEKLDSLKEQLDSVLSTLDIDEIGQSQLYALQKEIIHNSLLEGVKLPKDAVRSSLFRRLVIKGESPNVFDRRAQNCMELLVDAISLEKPLSREILIGWQAKAVLGTGTPESLIGRFRNASDGSMRVVSGPIGRERIHYETVPGENVEREMEAFLAWLNEPAKEHPAVKAAIAHLYFVLIHPFGDGNGRVARTVSEYVIARGNPAQAPFAGISSQLGKRRKEYDDQLDRIRGLDVSEWIDFNLDLRCLALEEALANIGSVRQKHALIHLMKDAGCSSRQMNVLYRAFDHEFTGRLTLRKYAKMAKCGIKDACLDLVDLVAKGILAENGKNFGLREDLPLQMADASYSLSFGNSPK